MKDKNIPQSVGGDNLSEPFYFPRKEEVCRRLDEFYKSSGIQKDVLPSSLFEGALYAMRKEHQDNNPDWMAQVAHSLREIFYKLGIDRSSAFRKYGSTLDEKIGVQEVGKYWNFITQITHHNFKEASKSSLIGGSNDKPVQITPELFESVVLKFGDIIFAVLRRQIDAHREIDEVFKNSPNESSINYIRELVYLNPDTHQYFFSKANEKWLDWLWENGFLDVIKQKAEDPTRCSYRTPELKYLVLMAGKVPAKVVDIMLQVKVSPETFNPEVVDRFLRICSILPADQLARVVKKIREEKWIPLMGVFNQWGFEYEKMFQKLAEIKDYNSIFILAEAVLSVRTKEEIEKEKSLFVDNPFYFNDLSYTKVFEHLAGVSDEYTEKAFGLVLKVMRKIVDLWSKKYGQEDEKVFKVYDGLMLIDVDFFDLKLGQKDHLSGRDNIRELAAVIVNLAQRLIGERCNQNKEDVRRSFKQYIGNFDDANPSLSDSRAIWRLRLFILSLCPEAFREELKKSFFRLFSVKRYYNEIISGAEYLKALRAGFYVLSDSDKRDYVKHVIEYFVKKDKEKESEKEDWHIRYGSRVLSVIFKYLTIEEKEQAKEKGFKLDPSYEPRPSVGEIRGGTVVPRGPITPEEFNKLPVNEIAEKLRDEWAPAKLREKYKNDDFLRPHNAEGAGELLRNDISKRLQDYVNNADLFFDRDVLDSHYTYSYLRGVQEAIKNQRDTASNINWEGIINLFTAIKTSGEKDSLKREGRGGDLFDAWLAGWDAVHSAMTDVLQELLAERDDFVVIDFPKYRNQIFEILSYLLSYPDPTPKDEEGEGAKISQKTDSGEDIASDPFTIAINSVRGRAFQTFVLFIYQDGKQFKKDDKIKIAGDVKSLYKKVLKKENTRALMFMFGHYLPSFYFRGKEWVKKLLPQIFPKEIEKKYLYIAAWEGYLSTDLYKEMFFDSDIQELYERGVDLTETDYPKQRHFKDPKESIGVHLALAFIYFLEFDFNHKLFKKFWKSNNLKGKKEFISFIGRHCISRDNPTKWIKDNKINLDKLKKFWTWVLKNITEPEVLSGFGFWINPSKEVLDDSFVIERISQTLEKSKGKIDWEYALLKRLPIFAKRDKKATLEIIGRYLLDTKKENLNSNISLPFWNIKEIKEALKTIATENDEIRQEVSNLISVLFEKGGSPFWELEEVLNN